MFARSGIAAQRPAGIPCPRPDLFFRPSVAAAVVLGGGRARRQPGRRPFHISTPRCQESASNFYEVLDLPTTATPGEIKKQFYKLSKAHHPDLHPEDPHAAQRFVRISEAHATLGSPEKKEKYDRDVVRPSQTGPGGGFGGAGAGGAPPGSFSSSTSGPGGRPASGLSRRRTQFRGPPPSFYRSGGWGAYGAKREENAYKASSSWEARGESASGPSGPAAGENPGSYSAGGGGTGPGGFTQGFDNDVRHFDQRGHQRTHSHIERNRHRARRRSAKGISEAEIDYSGGNPTVFNFVVVGGVLVLILGITRGIFGWGERKGKKKVKESEEVKGDALAGTSKA
ncbi:hypothetical protein KC356_g8866 [Hortaea werneckii]|nr:hypothetical protein KC356_g8866 [Hortaea werneckii]